MLREFWVLILTCFLLSGINSDDEDWSTRDIHDIIEAGEKDDLIIYDQFSSTKCNPWSACKGIDIKTIPFILDHVSWRFTNIQHLFDTDSTEKCLRDKRITLLGDSTMIEVANDLAILLSGLASDKATLDKYLYRTTHIDAEYSNFKLKNHVNEDYFGNHRNMTIFNTRTNTYIRSRFIGHYDLGKDDMGIVTLVEERFQPELRCLLGFNGCPKPDVVILNSGYHDRRHPLKKFKKVLFQFLHDLKHNYEQLNMHVDIIWAGTIVGTDKWKVITDLDEIAMKTMEYLRIPYVKASEVIEYVPAYHPNPQLYTPDFMHYGSVARLYDQNVTGAISMLRTQRLLNEVCNKYIELKVDKPREKTLHVDVI